AIGAFAAEIAARRRQEEAARRKSRSPYAGVNQRRKQLRAAYAASVRNFKAKLNQAQAMGMSKLRVKKMRAAFSSTGKIGGLFKTAQNYVTTAIDRNAANNAAARRKANRAAEAKAAEELRKELEWHQQSERQAALAAVEAERQAEEAAADAAAPREEKPWWVPSFSEREAQALVQAIPSVGIGSNRIPVPVAKIVAPGRMISFGTVTAWDIASNANPNIELRVDGYGAGNADDPLKFQTFGRVNVEKRELESVIRIPSGWRFSKGGFETSHGYSISTRAKWDGWGTTVSADMNYADVDVSGAGLKGNASSGVYVEVKPIQVLTIGVVVIALIVTPFDEIALLLAGVGEIFKRIPAFGR
ncbi:MAG: hypothetical protein QGD88_02920, partial [Anaerolineae bacterium]|nr:hypothetical protein [Anaerolineae bacterium]